MFKNTALEMIGQQDLKFRTEMIDAWQELIDNTAYGEDPTGNKYAQKIEKLLFDRTGVNCTLNLRIGDDWDFYTEPAILSKANPLLHLMAGKLSSLFFKVGKAPEEVQVFKGSVDFRNARLTGDYTKINMPIVMAINGVKNVGAEAAAGIFMHEAGHCWTFLACSWRLYRSSQFLQQIARAKLDSDKDRVDHILTRYSKKMVDEGLISPKDVKGLFSDFSIDTLQTTVLTSAVNKLQSDFGQLRATSHYSEQVADIFSTRFGFGAVLVESLKYNDSNSPVEFISGVLSVVILVSGFPNPLLAFAVTSFLAVILAGEGATGRLVNDGVDIYGTNSQRFTRIRQTVIDALKDAHIDRETREFLLSEIARIDKVYKETVVVKGLYKIIHEMIFSSERKLQQVMDMERQLEAMSNNDLFVGANRLKTLV